VDDRWSICINAVDYRLAGCTFSTGIFNGMRGDRLDLLRNAQREPGRDRL
jgi:hypothetical protein